jgi:hypothetical protein
MNTFLTEQLEKHRMSITLGLMLLLFIKFSPIVRWLDFSAAPIDLGILSVVLVAAFSVLTFMQLSLWLLHRNWPVLAEYAEYYLSGTFKSLESWQKVSFYMVFFLGLLLAFVVTLMALV